MKQNLATHLLSLNKTREMARSGFNVAILGLMEQRHIQETLMEARNNGESLTHDDIRTRVENSMPEGIDLHTEYQWTRQHFGNTPVRELEELSARIMMNVGQLEIMSERALFGERSGTSLDRYKEIHGSIADSLALVIEGARELDRTETMGLHHYKALKKVCSSPSGPLKKYYDEAVGILAARSDVMESSHFAGLRMRAA